MTSMQAYIYTYLVNKTPFYIMMIYLQVVLRCSSSAEYPYVTNKAVDPALPPTGLELNYNLDEHIWNYFKA